MSLLAGFDLLVELSNTYIQNQLTKQLGSIFKTASGSSGLPIDYSADKASPGSGNGLHLIITDIRVDLRAGDQLDLTLLFKDASSINASAQGKATVRFQQLTGKIRISNCRLQLTPSGTDMQPQLVLTQAQVSLQFDDPAANDTWQPEVETYFMFAWATILDKTQGAFPFGKAFTVNPTSDGTLSPLGPTALQVHTLVNAAAPADTSQQAVGMFFGLSKAAAAQGNPAAHPGTRIQPPNHFALAISPYTYQRFIFEPVTQQATQQPEIKHVSTSLEYGYIAIRVECEKADTWGSASGTVPIWLTLSIEDGQLQAAINVNNPENVTVHGSTLTNVLEGALILLGGGAAVVSLDFIAREALKSVAFTIIKDKAHEVVDKLRATLSSSLDLSRFSAAGNLALNELTEVAVSSEGILIQGVVQLKQTLAKPTLTLNRTTESIAVVNGETGTVKVNMFPQGLKTYPVTYQAQTMRARVKLDSTLVALPATVSWSVRSNNATVALPGGSGSVLLPHVSTTKAQPFPQGTTADQQTVHLTYEQVNSAEIVFTNLPADGNYDFTVLAQVVDARGAAPVGVLQPVSTYVEMTGSIAVLPDEYYHDQAQSTSLLDDILHRGNKIKTIPWRPLGPGPVEQIGIERVRPLLNSVMQLLRSNETQLPRNAAQLPSTRLAPLAVSRVIQAGNQQKATRVLVDKAKVGEMRVKNR